MGKSKLVIFFGILAVAIFATSAATGYGFFNSVLALVVFLGFWYVVSRLSGRSVKENTRLGKIWKKLTAIGHHLKIKDEKIQGDVRFYSSDTLDQIELWTDLITKRLRLKNTTTT